MIWDDSRELGLKLIEIIKEGYFVNAHRLISLYKGEKDIVFKLAEGMINFYDQNTNEEKIIKALGIFESLDAEELRKIDPDLMMDLYSYLSVTYSRIGNKIQAKKYETIVLEDRKAKKNGSKKIEKREKEKCNSMV